MTSFYSSKLSGAPLRVGCSRCSFGCRREGDPREFLGDFFDLNGVPFTRAQAIGAEREVLPGAGHLVPDLGEPLNERLERLFVSA